MKFYKKVMSKMARFGEKTIYTASETNYGDVQEEPGQLQPGKYKLRQLDTSVDKRPLGNFISYPNAHDNSKNKPESWTDPYLRYMDVL